MKQRSKEKYYRVTSVLSYLTAEWLQYWWRKVGFEAADKIRDDSTAYGKKVHKFLEDFVRATIEQKETSAVFPNTPEGNNALTIARWLQVNQVKPLELELEVKCPKLKLVGHFDLLAEIDGEKYILDYKTSKRVDKTYALQLSAYSYLVKKTLKMDVNKGIILRVDKETGDLEVAKYENLKPFWLIFKAGYTFFRFMQGK